MNENTEVKEITTPATGAETTAEETVAVPKGKFQSFLASLGLGEKDDAKADKAEEGKKTDGEKPQEVTDVNKAIAEAKKQWETEATKKAELDKLTGEDKIKAEADEVKAQLAEANRKAAERELKDQALTELLADGYPAGLVNCLRFDSKEAMETSKDSVIKEFQNAVETVVKERLRGKTPVGIGGANGSANLLQNQIAKNIRGGLN